MSEHPVPATDAGGRAFAPRHAVPPEDRELLSRLRGGDAAAFERIFRAHYARLVTLAEGLLRARSTAEDVVQDVMLELWRLRGSLTLEVSLRAYLYQATRNRALNEVRHGRIERRGGPRLVRTTTPLPPADALLAETELSAAIRAALALLPAAQREVFELNRAHGLRYMEIAATLGISVKTVEARMGKALRTLRERLAPWLADDRRAP